MAQANTSPMVHDRIREARKESGLTQEEVGSRVGVAGATFARWESGQREPDFKTLKKIGEALGVSCAWLLEETDDPTPAHGRTHRDGRRLYAVQRGEAADAGDTGPDHAMHLFELQQQIERHEDILRDLADKVDILHRLTPLAEAMPPHAGADRAAAPQLPPASRMQRVKAAVGDMRRDGLADNKAAQPRRRLAASARVRRSRPKSK